MTATPGYMELYDAQLQVNTRIADALDRIADALEEEFVDPLSQEYRARMVRARQQAQAYVGKLSPNAQDFKEAILAAQQGLTYGGASQPSTVVNNCSRNCACQAGDITKATAEDRTYEGPKA